MKQLFFVLTIVASSVLKAGGYWDDLDNAQKLKIWKGEMVTVTYPDAPNQLNFVKATNFLRISPQSYGLTVKDAAAIFWDLPGQREYLDFGNFGLKKFEIISGAGTATVNAIVTSATITSQGVVTLEYPQVNSVFRTNSSSYTITWHSTDPEMPPFFSGMAGLTGHVTFERIPEDNRGFLMVYHNVGFLTEEGKKDLSTLQGLKTQGEFLATKHRERLETGRKPTAAQMQALENAMRTSTVRTRLPLKRTLSRN